MRWVFYCMLAANAAYFSWQLRHLEPTSLAEPEVTIPGHVNRLLFISELESGTLRERGAAAPGTSPDTGVSIHNAADHSFGDEHAGGACYSFGPLTGDEDIHELRTWLEEQGAALSLRSGERRELALYWVYFPPFPNRREAIERVTTMRSEGIDDIFIIPGGDMAHAISLGVYSRQSSLERRLRELKSRGYDPSVVPRYRTKKASWYDVRLPQDYELPEEELTAEFPGVEATPAACT